MNIFIHGYYGFKNVGDDIMLNNILHAFIREDYIKHIYINVRSSDILDRIESTKITYIENEKRSVVIVLLKLWASIRSKYWIWGGGTCFYGLTDNQGLLNLAKWVRFCKYLNKEFIFLGIGIGKLDQEGKKITTEIINKSSYISFRELYSLKQAKLLTPNVIDSKFLLTGDMFFLGMGNRMKKSFQPKQKIKKIGISGVNYYKDNIDIIKKMGALVERFLKNDIEVFFVPFHLGIRNDNEFHKKIISSINIKKNDVSFIRYSSVNELYEKITTFDLTINFRLHSAIVSDYLGVPNFVFPCSNKITSYVEKTRLLFQNRIIEDIDDLSIIKCEKLKAEYIKHIDKMSEFIMSESKLSQIGMRKTLEYIQNY